MSRNLPGSGCLLKAQGRFIGRKLRTCVGQLLPKMVGLRSLASSGPEPSRSSGFRVLGFSISGFKVWGFGASGFYSIRIV